MPVEVGKFTTEVTVSEGDLPLSPVQIEALVRLVLRRLEDAQRAAERTREATTIRSQAAPRGR